MCFFACLDLIVVVAELGQRGTSPMGWDGLLTRFWRWIWEEVFLVAISYRWDSTRSVPAASCP